MKQPDDIARETARVPDEPFGTHRVSRGTVKWWRDAKGYGVIATAATAPWDIWCSFSAVEAEGFRVLQPGQVVDVEFVRFDRESFKYIARWVRVVGSPAGPADHGDAKNRR